MSDAPAPKPAPRSLRSAGIGSEYISPEALAASGQKVMLLSAKSRVQPATSQYPARTVIDIEVEFVGGRDQGATGTISLGLFDRAGKVYESRKALGIQLKEGALGPVIVVKQGNFITFVDAVTDDGPGAVTRTVTAEHEAQADLPF